MRKTALLLLGVLGLIWTSLQFGCQEPTLVTTRSPSSLGTVEGMLYYLPMGKITIQGEYTTPEQTPTPTPTAIATVTPTPTPKPSVAANKRKKDGNDTNSEEESNAISGGQLKITIKAHVEADQSTGKFYAQPVP